MYVGNAALGLVTLGQDAQIQEGGDVVAPQSILKTLENDDADAFASAIAVRSGVKCEALAIGLRKLTAVIGIMVLSVRIMPAPERD